MLRLKVRIAIGAPWYNGKRKIHEDMGVSYFADHNKGPT
jgi:hypothetical protein